MKLLLLLVATFSVSLAAENKLDFLSDEFIDYINSKATTWKAGRNFDKDTPFSRMKPLVGATKSDFYERKIEYSDFKLVDPLPLIPEFFDARTEWPQCADVIGTIADQSHCKSDWSISTTSAMSDRRCIASNGTLKVPVSAEDLTACAGRVEEFHDMNDCDGGSAATAWQYWIDNGIVTGGLYNSSVGCKPYSMQPTNDTSGDTDDQNNTTPECVKTCYTEGLDYEQELTFGTSVTYLPTEDLIIRDLLLNGPITSDMWVYEDFLHYKSGVYQHVAGKGLLIHHIRIIGWGEEDDIPYWLVANSWGKFWGDDGYFKILRGKNHCDIEESAISGKPKL